MSATPTPDGPKRVTARRATLREQQRAYTRERLLAGAVEVFERVGYTAATVDDIVAVAGASRATFYLHFPSKRDVIEVLSEQLSPGVNQYWMELDEILPRASIEDMRRWMRSAVLWVIENKAVIGSHAVATMTEGGPPQSTLSPQLALMPRLRERWPADDLDGLAIRISLLQVQFRATVAFLGDDWQSNPDRLVETLSSVWLAAFTPPS